MFGAEDEFTLRRNREAFDRVDLIPRIATETGLIDTSVELFGLNLDYPLLVAGRNS